MCTNRSIPAALAFLHEIMASLAAPPRIEHPGAAPPFGVQESKLTDADFETFAKALAARHRAADLRTYAQELNWQAAEIEHEVTELLAPMLERLA